MQIATTTCTNKIGVFNVDNYGSSVIREFEHDPSDYFVMNPTGYINLTDGGEFNFYYQDQGNGYSGGGGAVVTGTECRTEVNDYIAILYIPTFLILISMIILITLQIFKYPNPWK